MIEVHTVISSILADLQKKMPVILDAHDLKYFEAYGIGYPTDQAKLFCAVRFASADIDGDNETLSFTIHLQLLTTETVSYKYTDAVSEFINDINLGDYGFTNGNYSIENLENFRSADTQVFFDVSLMRRLDDCY